MQNAVKFNQGILIHGIDEPKDAFRKRIESILAPLTSFCSSHSNTVTYNVYISQEADINTVYFSIGSETLDEDNLHMLLRVISEAYVRLYASKAAKGIKDFKAQQAYKNAL